MLSIERIKELVDKNISDEEAKEIRDGLYDLAKIIFEKWRYEKNQKKKTELTSLNKTEKFLYNQGDGPSEN